MKYLQPAREDPRNCLRFRDQPSGQAVEVEVYYTGRSARARGIYLSIKPVTLDECSSSFNLMSLRSYLVRPLTRSSPRVLAAVASAVDAKVEALAATFREDPEAGYAAAKALADSLKAAA